MGVQGVGDVRRAPVTGVEAQGDGGGGLELFAVECAEDADDVVGACGGLDYAGAVEERG